MPLPRTGPISGCAYAHIQKMIVTFNGQISINCGRIRGKFSRKQQDTRGAEWKTDGTADEKEGTYSVELLQQQQRRQQHGVAS